MNPNHATLNGITWCPGSSVKAWAWVLVNQEVEITPGCNEEEKFRFIHKVFITFCGLPLKTFIHVFTWFLHVQHQHLSWPTLSTSSLSIPLSLHLCCTLLLCLSLLSTDPMACPSHPPSPLLSVCVWHNKEKGESFVQCQPCFQWALAQLHRFSLLII